MIWGSVLCARIVGESSNHRVGIRFATVGEGFSKKVTFDLRITDEKERATQNSGKNIMSMKAFGAKSLCIPGREW